MFTVCSALYRPFFLCHGAGLLRNGSHVHHRNVRAVQQFQQPRVALERAAVFGVHPPDAPDRVFSLRWHAAPGFWPPRTDAFLKLTSDVGVARSISFVAPAAHGLQLLLYITQTLLVWLPMTAAAMNDKSAMSNFKWLMRERGAVWQATCYIMSNVIRVKYDPELLDTKRGTLPNAMFLAFIFVQLLWWSFSTVPALFFFYSYKADVLLICAVMYVSVSGAANYYQKSFAKRYQTVDTDFNMAPEEEDEADSAAASTEKAHPRRPR